MLVTEDLATVSSVVMKVGELYDVDLPNVFSLNGEIHTGTPSGNLKRKIMVQIHFLQFSPQH